MTKLNVEKSKEMFHRAEKLIPGGVNSEIRGPAWGIIPGVYPMVVERGKGSKIYDADENEYVDFVLGHGPVILGHAHPKVNEAIKQQLEKGILFGLSTELEYRLAEKIVNAVPCADMVRFASTGSDVTTAAVRVSRLYTGKEKIAIMDWCYHGTHDWCQVSVGGGLETNYIKVLKSWGVPGSVLDEIIILPWNNLEIVEKILRRHEHELAAVICEPVTPEIPPEEGFLKVLRELTEAHDILLIFDEIKTGFRLALGGAQAYFGVTPDLATFSKCMGNGFPVSAIAGKSSIMEILGKVETSLAGTYNANAIAMVASLATLSELEARNGQAYKHLYELGRKLQKGMREAIDDVGIEAIVQGPEPGPFRLLFTELQKVSNSRELKTIDKPRNKKRRTVFFEQLVQRGIWSHPNHVWYMCTAHNEEDAHKAIEAVEVSLKESKKIV